MNTRKSIAGLVLGLAILVPPAVYFSVSSAQVARSTTIQLAQDGVAGNVTTLLSAVGATGAGSAIQPVAANKVFQVSGTFVGTVHAEGSLDNTNWTSLGNLTAAGKIANTEPWKYIRGNVTAYTSGSITMKVGD